MNKGLDAVERAGIGIAFDGNAVLAYRYRIAVFVRGLDEFARGEADIVFAFLFVYVQFKSIDLLQVVIEQVGSFPVFFIAGGEHGFFGERESALAIGDRLRFWNNGDLL